MTSSPISSNCRTRVELIRLRNSRSVSSDFLKVGWCAINRLVAPRLARVLVRFSDVDEIKQFKSEQANGDSGGEQQDLPL